MSGSTRKERRLPIRQFAILALVRFSEPIALTSVFPYLPAMMESFDGVSEADVGFWAGTAGAIFSFAQCLTAIFWGRASDRFGRKPVILLGLFNTMLTSLVWGFSTSLPMALAARALSGAGNGNIGILRTVVAELCPWKELQPRAFSIMPLIFSVGSVIGPAIGGALSNPLHRKKGDSPEGPLLWRYPYALPNIVASGFFLFGITVGILFLHETLASRKNRVDYGVELGKTLVAFFQKPFRRLYAAIFPSRGKDDQDPLLQSSKYSRLSGSNDVEQGASKVLVDEGKDDAPSYSEVLTRQTLLYLFVYGILAMHNTAFDQVIAVFMHHSRTGPSVGDVKLPLKFNQGFGMKSSRIGVLFTLNGFAGIFFQFVLFPPLAQAYGTLPCLKVVLHAMPIIYLIMPFTTLVYDPTLRQYTFLVVWLAKSLCTTFAFPCSTILLTNSASSLKALGTINGIATSVGAIGRAIGPTLAGAAFTWGVKRGYLITPFWLLTVMGVIAWLPMYSLVEGKGFGDDDEDDDEEDDEENVDEDAEFVASNTDGYGTLDPGYSSMADSTRSASRVDFSESEDGIGPLLGREISRGSQRLSRYGSMGSSVFTADESEPDDGRMMSSQPSSTQISRSGSQSMARMPPMRRRRSSAPIGTGEGFRRLSSNLGASRSGYGNGDGLGG